MTAQRVCALSELVQDEARRVEIDGVAMAVVLDSAGEVHAIGDTCTHGDISLSEGFIDGDTLEWGAPGWAFSVRPAKPRNRPASDPVPVFAVVIAGDDVLIDPDVKKPVG